ncbi:S8 family peptidase [Tenggerimyces flavus]|uniref:S8 family serine peptidase n=1 Tax=Tenggerimyces flavus TaxID=1708749 RepID=A0ABV7YH49_9ACTN|nr:S8 family serine peptidase [Tenggerimyces flavus]MBM7786010.1 subtilisin family serine protease [Tenggerimyces flavus]
MGSTPLLRAVVLAAALVVTGAPVPASAAPSPAAAEPQPQSQKAVTLLTGDRVVLLSPDGARLSVLRGPGRRDVSFQTERSRGHLYVIPTDAAPLVANGTLDRHLFDVTELAASGYHDRLPVIVTGGTRSFAGAGASAVRSLATVGGVAMRLDEPGTFWNALLSKQVRGKVWLDRLRKIDLDQSVPQIGAPAAWQAGFTGRGVKVAVLDTGVDAAHPSLAGQVVASRNFTTDPAGDGFGHGTHVASTIAGTNAKYRGVAYDAQILDGKVCDNSGSCPDSALIAGMHWAAVEQGARVINLSLSGEDTPDIDPLEQAVNDLTAQTGALFVAAAGNRPRCTQGEYVNSPATADAALSVGASDRNEQLAVFSCRGPRIGDLGMKPDVTAPGVGIVAAQAAGTEMGPVVEPGYIRASGTSMATPHVAGAAALLAQQHPSWKGSDLKAALMASAWPNPSLRPYDQGSGRIDVAAAIKQNVVTSPGGLSFGKQGWPHDDDLPVSRQLTYRNLGLTAATLALEATLLDANGQPAPAGALTVSASSVTVPAGGSATVTVTSNTRHDGPPGIYHGRIVASGGGQTVGVPLAVELEPESYDLTLSAVDRKGALTGNVVTTLYSIDDPDSLWIHPTDPSGVVTVRVPKGRYHLETYVGTARNGGGWDTAMLVRPLIEVGANTRVTLDSRLAKPVKVTLPRKSADAAIIDIGYLRKHGRGDHISGYLTWTLDGFYTAHLGPTVPDSDFVSRVTGQWGEEGPKGNFANTPYFYALNWFGYGKYVTGFQRTVKDSQLARITATFSSTVSKREGLKYLFGLAPGTSAGGASLGVPYDLPGKATQYVQPEGVGWNASFDEVVRDGQNAPVTLTTLRADERFLQPGDRVSEQWNAAVFGPSWPTGGKNPPVARSGDSIVMDVPLFSDAAGHVGASAVDAGETVLYRNGQRVAESSEPGVLFADVPAASATYRLATTVERSVADFSTRQAISWTFRSSHVESETRLPAAVARFAPDVDSRNRASWRSEWVPMALDPLPDSAFGTVRRPTVDVSFDDGTSWSRASVRPSRHGDFEVLVAPPRKGAFVSLRVSATDRFGNRLDQSVVRAYGLR